MNSSAFIVLFLLFLWQKDATHAISDQGAESRQKATERANVTFTSPPSFSDENGTVTWVERLEMTIERRGQANNTTANTTVDNKNEANTTLDNNPVANKTVLLTKRDSHSYRALQNFAKGNSFMAYSDEEGRQLVCRLPRVTPANQTELQTARCVGYGEVDGQYCMFIGEEALCFDEPEGPFVIDEVGDVFETPPTGEKSSELTGVEALMGEAKKRLRRQAGQVQYRAEFCVSADETVHHLFENHVDINPGATAVDDTKQFIFSTFNGVHDLYQRINSDTMNISIAVLEIVVAQNASDAQWADTSGVLNYNYAFPILAGEAWTLFSEPLQCDAVIGMTTKDISSTNDSSLVVGAARRCGMCNMTGNLSRGAVEVPYRLDYILAHEIGHLLCAAHDTVTNETDCTTPARVMNAGANVPDATNYNWSSCSIDTFEDFVTTNDAACLLQNYKSDAELYAERCEGFSGELLGTPEQMCKLLYNTT